MLRTFYITKSMPCFWSAHTRSLHSPTLSSLLLSPCLYRFQPSLLMLLSTTTTRHIHAHHHNRFKQQMQTHRPRQDAHHDRPAIHVQISFQHLCHGRLGRPHKTPHRRSRNRRHLKIIKIIKITKIINIIKIKIKKIIKIKR